MLALLVLVFALVVLRHAWMMDDAYITFRVVDNIFGGYGPVWNPGERVQVYTHPLWLLLSCVVYGITHEFFYSMLLVSTLISTAAVAIIAFKLARSSMAAITVLLAATLSHAFVDYSTSGLENPLSNLLFGLSAWVYLGRLPSARRFGLLCLLGGLALLNRPDNAVILGPLVLAAGIQAYRRGVGLRPLLRAMALAAIPLLTWELFSLFYYGMLVPNTALAKLNAGIPTGQLAKQGLFYIVATLDADPLTLVIIIGGMLMPFVCRERRLWPLAIGIALHMIYIVCISGDFMLGRFMVAPMFMAVVSLSQIRGVGLTTALIANAVLVTLGFTAHPNTLENNTKMSAGWGKARTARQITDERVLLYHSSSLLHGHRIRDMPDHGWRWEGLLGARPGHSVGVAMTVGVRGFAGGPEVHWVDQTALTDPLLSRLPAVYKPDWMTGHFKRAIPKGYVESLESGENRLAHPGIAMIYEHVDIVTHGELWSLERLASIWWLNTGGPRRHVPIDDYLFNGALKRSPSSLRWRVREGAELEGSGVRSFNGPGVYVAFTDLQQRSVAEISLNEEDRFEMRFYDRGEELARVPVPRARTWSGHGMVSRRVELPEILQEYGFNQIRILPLTKNRSKPDYAIGHLLFDEEIETAPPVSQRPGHKNETKVKPGGKNKARVEPIDKSGARGKPGPKGKPGSWPRDKKTKPNRVDDTSTTGAAEMAETGDGSEAATEG